MRRESPKPSLAHPFARAHARAGWTLLFLALLSGAALELLEAYRWAPLVLDAWRQRLWTLAHFHGAALGLINVVYGRAADPERAGPGWGRLASFALIAGSVLMPLGFWLGAFGHSEGDPSIAIALAPIGAACVLYGIGHQAIVAWRQVQ